MFEKRYFNVKTLPYLYRKCPYQLILFYLQIA